MRGEAGRGAGQPSNFNKTTEGLWWDAAIISTAIWIAVSWGWQWYALAQAVAAGQATPQM